MRVGLLGLGTVGSGVAEILARHQKIIAERAGVSLELTRALVRSRRRRTGAASHVPLTQNPAEVIASPDVDVVCELIGGMEPARQLVSDALAAGKPVVTANKAILAEHGSEIFAHAKRGGTDVYFEAAVAGGIPIIRTLREGLASDRVSSIEGILNGTTNYILGVMQEGGGYDTALRQAQRLGFAEADPTLDVNGQDAADKLAILLQLAFGMTTRPRDISVEGITGLTPEVLADAQDLGFRVKLLAIGRRAKVPSRSKGGGEVTKEVERVDARVHPSLVPVGHPLSAVSGPQNAISVVSDALGPTLYQGAGAGGLPTGSAVVSDLIEAARDLRAGISGRVVAGSSRHAPGLMRPADAQSSYYVRLEVEDRPGVLASVTYILAKHHISLATVLQRERAGKFGMPVPVVLTTHPARHGAMGKALAGIRRLPALRGSIHCLRMEEPHAES